jgi:hypothetical protein
VYLPAGIAAAVVLGLLPQVAKAQRDTAQATQIRLVLAVPRAAVLRRAVPAGVTVLADGRRELTVDVTVGANCEWTLGVRRRAWWDRRALPPIEVQRENGDWIPLEAGEAPVPVIDRHPACDADTHVIRLRVPANATDGLLDRVEFVVAPTRP